MIPASFSLAGRVVLVTGAGSPDGIGFASARLLGELGASVAVTSTTDRIEERVGELTATGIAASGHIADLTQEDAADRLVSEVVDAHGALGIVVNNAGMVSVGSGAESGSLLGMDLATWRAGIARNLDSAFLVCRAAIPHLIAREWGRIVNVSSVTGPVMATRDEPAYAAAKAGMDGLMRAMAIDFAAAGITANSVAPPSVGRAALGGGGYEWVDVVPRAWAHLIAIATGHPIAPETLLPEAFHEFVLAALGRQAPGRMTDGRQPWPRPFDQGFDPDDPIDRAVMETRDAVFPHHGLTAEPGLWF